MHRHVMEILEDASNTSGTDADGSLHLDEIYERFIHRRTKQALAAMVRDGLVVRLACGCYALARWVQDGIDCESHAPHGKG